MEIPIVKLGPIGLENIEKPGKAAYQNIGYKLHEAFASCGFVYLLEHGVRDETINQMFKSCERFFKMPAEDKRHMFSRHPVTHQGFVEPGQEILDNIKEEGEGEKATHELREMLDIYCLSKESKFPDEHFPEIRNVFESIGEQFLLLAERIFRCLALALKLEEDFLVNRHQKLMKKGSLAMMRSIYYPPIKGELPPRVVRCGEHTDFGTLTFLLQDQQGGLEVKGRDGSWIAAKPVGGSILVNIGDMMEIFTNGELPATLHRVLVPKDDKMRSHPRQSFAFFMDPDNDVRVKPIHGQKPKSQKYEEVGVEEYISGQINKTFIK